MAKQAGNQQSTSSGSSSVTESGSTASGLDQDAEDQFEVELLWCIQQLQAGLMDLKLQEKQVYNMTKSLNVLKSNNASLIKKRQVMRNTFGDYRAKMSDDEKKFSKSTIFVKFTPSNIKKLDKKSLFLKKAVKPTETTKDNKETCGGEVENEQSSRKAIINVDVSNEKFKFNFPVMES